MPGKLVIYLVGIASPSLIRKRERTSGMTRNNGSCHSMIFAQFLAGSLCYTCLTILESRYRK
jgi:hypothetical protein